MADESDDEAVVVSRDDLEAVERGEKRAADVYERRPQWGRRAALAAIAGTGAAAFLGGQATAQTSPSGTIGPADEGIFAQISGDIVADGETVTDLLNVEVYETSSDVPSDLPAGTIALHG